jgi:hypothetical protein
MIRDALSLSCGLLAAVFLGSGCDVAGPKGAAERPPGAGMSPAAAPAAAPAGTPSAAPAAEWAFNGTIIEACSCPMFCQCYFASKPADHGPGCHMGGEPGTYCRFNNAFRTNSGRYGNVKLDGARFWVAGDLGGDFSKGEMQWAVLTFDPSVTKEQREGIQKMLAGLYPVKWGSFKVAPDAPMEWQAARDRAVAKLNGGKTAEVVLKKNQGMSDDPIVIKNLRYWGAPRNDGFVLMQNEVEAYREGEKPFEFKGSNGFMITVDITSKDNAGA